MDAPKIWTFFYGSYMNLDVLREAKLVPEQYAVASLDGFEIQISPRANLVHAEGQCVWGIVATASHAELDRLYQHAREVLGEIYLPEAVLTRTRTGDYRPALCYLCPNMEPRPAEAAYVDRIVAPARRLQFPGWYVERLLSFAPRLAR